MCGRYASSRTAGELADEFGVDELRVDDLLPADWNVAPTKEVYAVVERPPREDRPQERQLRTLRWGLVPSWAKDRSVGNRMINARMESVADKPAFRRAFAARRCLLPADGYYEWYVTERLAPTRSGKAGKPVKQPFFIRPRDGGVLAMAGLYEIWRDPTKTDDDPHPFLWSFAVITTDAPDDLGRIHERMPLMVERDRWDEWLDPTHPATLDLLVPAAPGRLEAYPVSTQVNNADNNGPELVEPLPVEGQPAEASEDRGDR